MDIRFHNDPETDLPHIHDHGVSEDEFAEVLRGPGEDLPADRGARMKLGQSSAGRYLQVIYVPDEQPGGVFVITAYELRDVVRTGCQGRALPHDLPPWETVSWYDRQAVRRSKRPSATSGAI